jgi:Zn-dependent protease with chaperone function
MRKQRGAAILILLSILFLQLACGRGGSSSGTATGSKSVPHFKPGFNLFKPEQDIELGRKSAQQVERQMPVLNDSQITGYVQQLGKKLVAKAGGYDFPYEFHVVANKEINAFALPGGFVFVNAGAIAAAKNEGELAGVMAHEISHVVLRHGTNQATKAYIAKAGLDVLSGIVGGESTDLGQIINTVGGIGANALFLKFGRSAETEADLEGARIMAEAGYDPRDMAKFFKTLQDMGGQRVPELLSDHPDPGNRYEAVTKQAASLPVSANPIHDTEQFEQVKARITSGGAMDSSSRVARVGPNDPSNNKPGTRPEPPASSFTQFRARDGAFAMEYPANWDALSSDEINMIFAPKGAYGKMKESVVVTHGIFIGAVSPQGRDLASATAAFIQQQVQSNPDFSVQKGPERYDFGGGREGFATLVAGPSPVTGVVEVDVIYTTTTSDGRLFYFITISPKDEYTAYRPAFEHIINSIQLQ